VADDSVFAERGSKPMNDAEPVRHRINGEAPGDRSDGQINPA
jgi:hypothetical protein